MFFLEVNPDHYGVLFSPLFSPGIELVFMPCPWPKLQNMVNRWHGSNLCHSQHIICIFTIFSTFSWFQ